MRIDRKQAAVVGAGLVGLAIASLMVLGSRGEGRRVGEAPRTERRTSRSPTPRKQTTTPPPAPSATVAPAGPSSPSSSTEDTAGDRTWSFERDDAGRVVATDGPAGRSTLVRDPRGRVIARTDATGRCVRIAYDPAGRPIAFDTPNGRESRTFDHRGQLVAASAGGESLRWTHGERWGDVTLEDAGSGVTLRYGGTAARQTVDTPWGRTTWLRDAQHRVESLETPAGTFRLERDERGRPVALHAPNGVVTRLHGDATSRGVEAIGPAGDPLLAIEREFDGRGRVARFTRDGVTTEATYDEADRLASFGKSAWSYDEHGDRVTERGARGEQLAATYDARGRIATRGTDRGTERFVHDAAGRLLRREGPAGATRYGWDVFGRLVSVASSRGESVAYTYDPFDRLATRVVTDPAGVATTTRFVWEGSRLLAELGPSGAVRQWVHGPGLDEPLAYRDVVAGEAGAWTFLHGDELGHVLAYSDEAGRRVDRTTFSPWGEVEQAPAAGRPVLFSGRLVDPITGLVHLRARWYDPTLGRFVSPDPAGLDGGPNAFTYVRNDPLRRIDPLGLWDEELGPDLDEPPAWLETTVTDWAAQHSPDAVVLANDLTVVAWNQLDLETRDRLRSPQAAALWAAEVERKVAEKVRGVERDWKELALLAGEVVGIVKGTASAVKVAAVEGGKLVYDTVAVGVAAAHDAFADESNSWLETFEPTGNLAQVFAEGKQLELLKAIVTELPARIAEGARRTGVLAEDGEYYAAGQAFGETILTETAALLSLGGTARQGATWLKNVPRGQRLAAVRDLLKIQRQPGPGDAAVAALVNRLKGATRTAPQATSATAPVTAGARAAAGTHAATAAPEAAAASRAGATGTGVADAAHGTKSTGPVDGLAQRLDPTAARGAPRPMPGEGSPAPRGPPAKTYTRADASDLLEASEGRLGLPNKKGKQFVGHAGDHVPLNGERPWDLAERRPSDFTTVYRRRSHAEQDLRDVLQRHADEIERLPRGKELGMKGERTSAPRDGYDSEGGRSARSVTFDVIDVVVERLPDGSLHLAHFTPRIR